MGRVQAEKFVWQSQAGTTPWDKYRGFQEFVKAVWEEISSVAEETFTLTSGEKMAGPFEALADGPRGQFQKRVYLTEAGGLLQRRGRFKCYYLGPTFFDGVDRIQLRPSGSQELPYPIEGSLYLLANADPDLFVGRRRHLEQALLALARTLGDPALEDLLRKRAWRRAREAFRSHPEESLKRALEGEVGDRIRREIGWGSNLRRLSTSLRSEAPRLGVAYLERFLEEAQRSGSASSPRERGKSYDFSLYACRLPDGDLEAYASLEYRGMGNGHYGLLINRKGSILLTESD